METEKEENKNFKYKIPREKLIEAIKADNNEFSNRVDEFKKIGIERLTGEEINEIIPSKLDYYMKGRSSEKFTFIQSAHIKGIDDRKLLLNKLKNESLCSLIFYQCNLPSIEFRDCQFTFSEQDNGCQFFISFIRTNIKYLIFKNSSICHLSVQDNSNIELINIFNLSMRDLSIIDGSRVNKMNISGDSKVGDISITQNSILNNVQISDSRIGDFNISNDCTTGNVYLTSSTSKSFNILNSNSGNISIYLSRMLGDFLIVNSYTKTFNIDKSAIESFKVMKSKLENFYIKRNSSSKSLVVRYSTVKDIDVDNSTIEDLMINPNSQIGHLRIQGQSNAGNINIIHSETESILIKNSMTDLIKILRSNTKDININNCSTGNFEIRNSITGVLSIQKIVCAILIIRSKIPEFYITNSHLIELIIGVGSDINLNVVNGSINYLNLRKSSVEITSSLILSNVALYACVIEEFNNLGRIYFRKVRAMEKDIIFQKFISQKQEELINEKIDVIKNKLKLRQTTFRIYLSSLGNFELMECKLEKFDLFEFKNSRINEVFISGSTLPKDDRIRIYNAVEESEEWYDQMVSFFEQLSSIFLKHGNIFRSVEYKSISTKYKHESLKSKRLFHNKFNDIFQNWLQRFPFFWNKVSSDYGASWGKAVWFIFWTSVLLYLCALLSTGNLFRLDMNFDLAFIGFYFDFINPLRPFDFFSQIKLNVNGWTRLIDLLSRIVIGYGIYQLIVAFRRYGRKM